MTWLYQATVLSSLGFSEFNNTSDHRPRHGHARLLGRGQVERLPGRRASAPGNAGKPGFPGGDVLYLAYGSTGPTDPVSGQKAKGLLIGDFNRNGVTDGGEKTIFLSVSEAQSIVSGGGGSNAI